MSSPTVQPIRPDKDLRAILNEFGDLNLEIEHLAPKMARHAVLKEIIVDLAKDEDGAKPCVFAADRWTIQFMPRENKRKIFDPRKAFAALKKAIGLEALMAVITIPLGDGIDKFIPEEQHKLFLAKTRTGPRSMKVIPTEPPPKVA